MIEIIKKITINVLMALYEPFGFAVILACLFMCVYIFAEEHGWKVLVQRWVKEFKTRPVFRRAFLLAFYTAMILFRTLLNRVLWESALGDVIGVWGLYDQNGELTTEIIENLVLFIPFTVLLLWGFQEKIIGQSVKLFITVWKSVKVIFIFSLTIELLQLILRLGTFQLSDLFYNTLGGLVGGLIYWGGHKVKHRKERKFNDDCK